jgi:bifunctional ADP-heptose synthase (sugar kinase/adenylyltransferase)
MTRSELQRLLAELRFRTIVILGDVCLDRYLFVDPSISDNSVETGLPINQVVRTSSSPGGAGSVLMNVAALGVGTVLPVGFVGDDGEGFELTRLLAGAGIDLELLLRSPDRPTPTFIKPALSAEELARVTAAMEEALERASGLIISDYGEAGKCGTVCTELRSRVLEMIAAKDNLPVVVDSRLNITGFPGCSLKPNLAELRGLLGGDDLSGDIPAISRAAVELSTRENRPMFVTIGEGGIIAAEGGKAWHVAGYALDGDIDPVGAGDSVIAAVTAALSCASRALEAALLGVLVSSITVQQIGMTGTASPEQITARYDEYVARHGSAAAAITEISSRTA